LAVKDAQRAARQEAAARAISFRQVATEFVRAQRVKWSNPKHAAQWDATLSAYAFPLIGDTIVGDIDANAVLKVLTQETVVEKDRSSPLWEARPETASLAHEMEHAASKSWLTALVASPVIAPTIAIDRVEVGP
jgi:hypothetical protein